MIERNVRYFEKSGQENTDAVIEALRTYLEADNQVVGLIVASVSGQTALKVKRKLLNTSLPIVSVTGPPSWQEYPQLKLPLVSEKIRKELQDANVRVVDSVPSSLSDTIEFSFARYGYRSPTWIFIETLLAVGGYGLKTAVECILMATDGGYVPPFKEVISIAGFGAGADTAIVARSTFSTTVFSSDFQKRFVIKEILAMPREKTFHSAVTLAEWNVQV